MTAGSIMFDGMEIGNAEPHAIAAMGLSRTFQRAQVFPRMNCLENVMVGHHPRMKIGFLNTMLRPPFRKSAEEEAARHRGTQLLDMVGLSGYAERMATDLVWVECQLLQIARSLASEPNLLILDEPTAGMGPEESLIIGKLVGR